jgi:WD40 repeat protein
MRDAIRFVANDVILDPRVGFVGFADKEGRRYFWMQPGEMTTAKDELASRASTSLQRPRLLRLVFDAKALAAPGGPPMPRVPFLAAACLMPFLATTAAAQRTPPVHTAALAPDGKALAESFAFVESPGVIRFHDLPTGKVRFVCSGHTDAVNTIAFSPDGKMLASGDCVGAIRLWDTATGKELATFNHEPRRAWSLAFSPDGKTLASSSPSRVLLWEVLTGKRRAVIETGGQEVNSVGQHAGCWVVFSPDGRTLACAAEGGAVWLWDARTCKQRLVLHGHEGAVLCVAFAPGGRTVATAGLDQTVRLWDAETGRQTATLRGHKGPVVSVVFSPDGRMAASWCSWRQKIKQGKDQGNDWCGTELKVWEVATARERLTFEPDRPQVNSWRSVFALQFTGNCNDLLTVTADRQGVDRFDLADLALRPKARPSRYPTCQDRVTAGE